MRQRILDAARELFVHEGYDAVSMRRIAARIEYSPTAIYLHFPDKESILSALCDETFEKLSARLTAHFTRTTDPLTKPVPVTVRLNAALPAERLAGFSVVIVGTGLATVTIPLNASRVNVLFAYHRTWQVAPTAVGAVNITVAPVSPTAGGVWVPDRYA